MEMNTGEVFGWLMFLVVITVLFFAAFGTSNIDEHTIEDYMANLIDDIRTEEGRK